MLAILEIIVGIGGELILEGALIEAIEDDGPPAHLPGVGRLADDLHLAAKVD